jgi:VanZ family protein
MSDRLARALLFIAVATILVATLTPASGEPPLPHACVLCAPDSIADAVSNVLLFAPLGLALAWLGWPLRRAVLAAALLSGFVELMQLWIIPGRDASITDVVTNTIGGCTGFIVFDAVRRLVLLATRTRRWLALGCGAIAAAGLLACGELLTPAFPPTIYHGQWTANLGGDLDWYRGRVRDARIGPYRLPSHRLEHQDEVRRLLQDGARLQVRGLAGPRTDRLAPFFSIYDERRLEILLLGPDRDDFVLRYRMRASDWQFNQPDLRIPDAMRDIRRGDTLEVAFWHPAGGRGYCVLVAARTTCGIAPSVGLGWSLLLYPEHLSRTLKAILGILFIAVFAVPIGFGAGELTSALAGGALAAGALFGAPALAHGMLIASPPGEWLGLVLGLAVGLCLERLVRLLGPQVPNMSATQAARQRSILA